MTNSLLKEKQEELEKLKSEMESENNPDVLAKAKEAWLGEQEGVWQKRLKTEVNSHMGVFSGVTMHRSLYCRTTEQRCL